MSSTFASGLIDLFHPASTFDPARRTAPEYDPAATPTPSHPRGRPYALPPWREMLDDAAAQERLRGGGGSGLLVCEFRGLLGCRAVFGGGEAEAWMGHISRDHLRDRFPARSACCFCDAAAFDADSASPTYQNSRRARPETDEERHRTRRRVFRRRLEHVRQHMVQAHAAAAASAAALPRLAFRPDAYLLRHMRSQRLLDEDTFQLALSCLERPVGLPCPSGKHKPIETRPLDWDPPHKILERERRSQIVYDQEKEDRMRRKEKRGR